MGGPKESGLSRGHTLAVRSWALVWTVVALGGCTAADRALLAEAVAPAAATAGGAMLLSQQSLGVVGGSAAAAGAAPAAAEGAAAGGNTAAAAVSAQAAHYALLRQFAGAALVAYALYDPLAPNWEITVKPAGEGIVRLSLAMRALTTGGNGEAWRIFQRAAQKVVEQNGARHFQLLAFEEGVHSTRPFAQRYAVGEIRLVP